MKECLNRELTKNEIKIVGITAIVFLTIAFAFTSPMFIFNIDVSIFERYGKELLSGNGSAQEWFNWCYERGLADIWVNHEKLSCVLTYKLNQLMPFGYPIVSLLVIMGIIIYLYLKRRASISITTLLVCLVLLRFNFAIGLARPATMSTICVMLLLLFVMNSSINGELRYLILASLLVFWALAHGGSYPLAIVILCVFAADKFFKILKNKFRQYILFESDLKKLKLSKAQLKYVSRDLVVGFIATLLLLVPKTTRESILYSVIQHGNTNHITEWMPMYKNHIPILIMIMAVLIYLAYKVVKGDIKISFMQCVLVIALIVESVNHLRYMQYLSVVVIVLVLRNSFEYSRMKIKDGLLVTFVCIFALVLTVGEFGENVATNEYDLYEISEHIVINEDLEKTLVEINKLEEDELVIAHNSFMAQWLLKRDYKIMIDGRIDNLHPEFYEFCYNLLSNDSKETSANLHKQLKEYGINVIIIPTRNRIVDMAINDWSNAEIKSSGDTETSLTVIYLNWH